MMNMILDFVANVGAELVANAVAFCLVWIARKTVKAFKDATYKGKHVARK